MALVCRNGAKECDGCMACYEAGGKPLEECVLCRAGIFEGDVFFDFGDGPICAECAQEHRYIA